MREAAPGGNHRAVQPHSWAILILLPAAALTSGFAASTVPIDCTASLLLLFCPSICLCQFAPLLPFCFLSPSLLRASLSLHPSLGFISALSLVSASLSLPVLFYLCSLAPLWSHLFVKLFPPFFFSSTHFPPSALTLPCTPLLLSSSFLLSHPAPLLCPFLPPLPTFFLSPSFPSVSCIPISVTTEVAFLRPWRGPPMMFVLPGPLLKQSTVFSGGF